MGAETSVLQKFDIGEPFEQISKKTDHSKPEENTAELKCAIFPAVRKKDGKPVTLLKLGKKKEDDLYREEILIEVLKTTRHPNIIKFLGLVDCGKSQWLITEEVVPLSSVIENLEDDELICGLFDIIKALSFFHSKCNLTHNNIKLSSIFVSSSQKTWKLGAMEKVCSIKKSPQLVKEDMKMFAAFAISILDMLQEPDFAVRSLAKKLDSEILQLENDMNSMQLESLLEEQVFRSPFIEISSFLDDITLKTSEEKDVFFKSLYSRLKKMNREVLMKRLAPQLFSNFILAEPAAEEFFLPYLFRYSGDSEKAQTVDSIFKGTAFKDFCVPIILDLLQSRDTYVRLVLLKFLPSYVGAFSKDTLKSEVLSEVVLGLKDLSDDVVAATFKALSYLVPVLGGEIVVGGERSKYFVDRRPKFKRLSNCSCGEDSSDSSNQRKSIPQAITGNSKSLKALERKKQREMARQIRIKDKEKSPSRPSLGAERVKTGEDIAKQENGESEPEWEEYEASSAESEDNVNEPVTNSKGRPTATVQPVLKSAGRDNDNCNNTNPDKLAENSLEHEIVRDTGPAVKQKGSALRLKQTLSNGASLPIASNEEEDNVLEDYDSEWVDQFDPIEFDTLEEEQQVTGKEEEESINIEIRQDTTNKQLKTKQETSTRKGKSADKLGAEFEVEAKVVRQTEVDFFADMAPDVKVIKAPLLPMKESTSNISSKFTVTEQDINEEVAAGWEEDGWDEFT